MQEAAKNLLLVLVALFPIVDPLGGSPFFLALTREYAPEARRALSWRIAMNSFFLAGWVVFCWDLRARLFWDFTASGAGRRRPDCHRDRMDAVERARRRKTRGAQNRPAAGHIPPGILSLNDAADSRSWIHLRGDHAGRKRVSPSLVSSFDNLGCTHWIGVDRDQHLLCYGFADRLARILGATGMTVITQLSSFFLVCIGVQIAWNGIKALLESLTLHFG